MSAGSGTQHLLDQIADVDVNVGHAIHTNGTMNEILPMA